jgi:cytochrome c oxidase subunit II
MRLTNLFGGLAAVATGTLAAGAAVAQVTIEGLEIKGAPVPGGMGFQHAATELAADIHWLDGLLLVIITAISLFRAGAPGLGHRPVQPPREPDARALHPQLPD